MQRMMLMTLCRRMLCDKKKSSSSINWIPLCLLVYLISQDHETCSTYTVYSKFYLIYRIFFLFPFLCVYMGNPLLMAFACSDAIYKTIKLLLPLPTHKMPYWIRLVTNYPPVTKYASPVYMNARII